MNCESAIGQHLLTNPECAKTYTDDNFRIIGQGRSSSHLSDHFKPQNPDMCKQKDFICFAWNLQVNNGNWANWPLLGPIRHTNNSVGTTEL